MRSKKLLRAASLILLLPALACVVTKQTPQPAATVQQLVFEVQTSTPTLTPVLYLLDAPTNTPDPRATSTPVVTTTLNLTPTLEIEPAAPLQEPAPNSQPPPATPTPVPTPEIKLTQGGVWDFEEGFTPWFNPHGDVCSGSGLANGWTAFTTRDQYGSSCFNQTVWKDNVYSGESAQEITFAYVGNQAGIFKTAPTVPGHRYTITAYMRREFSPAKLEVSLGLDLTGGGNWQAESVLWFPWREDVDDAWTKTEETITATGEAMTVFIQGVHPYPEPGGVLRLDAVTIADLGPEQ